jgi:hypothetical protein
MNTVEKVLYNALALAVTVRQAIHELDKRLAKRGAK